MRDSLTPVQRDHVAHAGDAFVCPDRGDRRRYGRGFPIGVLHRDLNGRDLNGGDLHRGISSGVGVEVGGWDGVVEGVGDGVGVGVAHRRLQCQMFGYSASTRFF